MADVDSTLISNRAATPRVANDPWTNAVLKTTGLGLLEVSTSETSTAQLRFCRVRSNAVVRQVNLYCDAVSTSGAIDVGLYQTDDNGSAVVDADFFASAQVVTSALAGTNVAHESGVYGIEDLEKPLWEALGLSADPQIDYDVVGTVTTNMGGAGTIGVEVVYVDGGA